MDAKQQHYAKSLELINKTIGSVLNGPLESYCEESQNMNYEGFLCTIDQHTFRSRLAKKTPTKKGYFVVFWEKDVNNQNQVFNAESSPEFLIVNVVDKKHKGVFLFSKDALIKYNILRTSVSQGKMAMRVYPGWEQALNRTAEKTQKWQTTYFIDVSKDNFGYEKLKTLLHVNTK